MKRSWFAIIVIILTLLIFVLVNSQLRYNSAYVQLDPLTGVCSIIRWNPDGTKIASTSGSENVIKIWDTTTNELILLLAIPKGNITALSWDKDGKILAIAMGKSEVYLLNIENKQGISVLNSDISIYNFLFINNQYLAIEGTRKNSNNILVLNINNLNVVKSISHDFESELPLWSVSTEKIATVTRQNKIELSSFSPPYSDTFDHYSQQITSISLSNDATLLSTVDINGNLFIRNIDQNRRTRSFKIDKGIYNFSWSPDDEQIAWIEQTHQFNVLSLTGTPNLKVYYTDNPIQGELKWSQDGLFLSASYVTFDMNDNVFGIESIWKVDTGKQVLDIMTDGCSKGEWSTVSNRLAVVNKHGYVEIWDMAFD